MALLLCAPAALAAPKATLLPFWTTYDETSTMVPDHAVWEAWLQRYLDTGVEDGIYRVRYAQVSVEDRQGLENYLRYLQAVPVRHLTKARQRAYWINLYNALTVALVLRHYPVRSIRDIGISPGWFSVGPWQAKLVNVEGQALSLDDIEHGILRPLWPDPRNHYAVNCASLGCPNLQPHAFTASNTESLLDAAAQAYINNARGAEVRDGRLTVSRIYQWFQDDFGGSPQSVIQHLRHYARGDLAKALIGSRRIDAYRYDWRLNSAQ